MTQTEPKAESSAEIDRVYTDRANDLLNDIGDWFADGAEDGVGHELLESFCRKLIRGATDSLATAAFFIGLDRGVELGANSSSD